MIETHNTSTAMKLILASRSPRRAEILRNAGFTFEALPVDVDETHLANEPADDYVLRLAGMKARAAVRRLPRKQEPAIVIGADTAVLADGRILGKPADAEDARRMLCFLSGRSHEVLTGVSLVRVPDGAECLHVEKTDVKVAVLSEREIGDYLRTGEPFDKAGAYGIQGIGGRFVSRINGCYFNVMGLPIARLCVMLRQLAPQRS